eukprot:SAG31_NODE_3754_length_3920_cov_2.925936_1_plen_67_part_00
MSMEGVTTPRAHAEVVQTGLRRVPRAIDATDAELVRPLQVVQTGLSSAGHGHGTPGGADGLSGMFS